MADSAKTKVIPPFLSKCYDMVDDPATDPTISWGGAGASFVIWDIPTLEQQLLPKYYKHRNFSSFIRQLNVYGFKKNDPGCWEFTNEWFIKGHKQFLWNITRKKSIVGNGQQDHPQEIITSMKKQSSQDCGQNQLQKNNTSMKRKSSKGNRVHSQPQENSTSATINSSQHNTQQNESQNNITSAGACVEVGKFRLWEEVEILKKDKDIVMQEIAKLGNHQQGADGKLHRLGQRIQGMEISQQQLMSFLAMVVQSPGFLGQLLQQNEGSWVISEIGKKRPYLALDQGAEYNELVASDGQMVTYQPLKNEMPKSLLTSSLNFNGHQQFDFSASGLSNFFENLELMQSEESMAMPMEQNGHCDENQIVVPYLLEDGMLELEKLLLASPPPERVEPSEPNSTGTVDSWKDLNFTEYNTSEEPSQTLFRLTKELGLLISDSNNEDEKT